MLNELNLARNLHWIIELTTFDRQSVLRWCIIQAILGVCWLFEEDILEKAHQLTDYAEHPYLLA